MTRIYKRKTQNAKPKKKNWREKDANRKRKIIMNFRVDEEEKELIENRIKLLGVMKRDFFVQSCLNQKIVTYGNVKTFEAIKKKLNEIESHLKAIDKIEDLNYVHLESLRTILEILDGLNRQEEECL